MSEKEEISKKAEEVKKETIETAKKVKETIKNVNVKEETTKAKGFIVEMFKNPIEKVKEIANSDNNYLKTTIFILIIWTIAVFIKSTYSTIYYWGFSRVWTNILDVLKNILAPVLGILAYSVIIFIFNKKNKKGLTSIISTVTATQLPLVIASIVALLTIFSYEFTKITVAFTSLCTVISIVLSYFGYKEIFKENDDEKFIKKFILLQVVYYLVYLILTFLGIHIY